MKKEVLAALTNMLDEIANKIEKNGMVKTAKELDVITNTLEKFANIIPAGSERPAPIFSDSSSKVKDKKDHFPIPDIAHARNALARVNQYSEVPSWYDGSLEELRSKVKSTVHSKFPSIKIAE
jgi:hypothetical protein